MLTTHGIRTVPQGPKVDLRQLGNNTGDGESDEAVSLEFPGPKVSVVDTLPPSFFPSKVKDDAIYPRHYKNRQ